MTSPAQGKQASKHRDSCNDLHTRGPAPGSKHRDSCNHLHTTGPAPGSKHRDSCNDQHTTGPAPGSKHRDSCNHLHMTGPAQGKQASKHRDSCNHLHTTGPAPGSKHSDSCNDQHTIGPAPGSKHRDSCNHLHTTGPAPGLGNGGRTKPFTHQGFLYVRRGPVYKGTTLYFYCWRHGCKGGLIQKHGQLTPRGRHHHEAEQSLGVSCLLLFTFCFGSVQFSSRW